MQLIDEKLLKNIIVKKNNNGYLTVILEADYLAPYSIGIEVMNVINITNHELRKQFIDEVMFGLNQ